MSDVTGNPNDGTVGTRTRSELSTEIRTNGLIAIQIDDIISDTSLRTHEEVSILEIAGTRNSGPSGFTVFRLSDVRVPDASNSSGNSFLYLTPVAVVATPQSLSPTMLSLRHSILGDPTTLPNDVEIEVKVWNPDGTPAAFVNFDWLCRVPIVDTVG